MQVEDFHTLFSRHGGYSLPVLIELRYPERDSWYFTNNMVNVIYGGNEYTATTMDYKAPSSKDGVYSGGSLEITIEEQKGVDPLLRWFDLADHKAGMICHALINKDGTIAPLARFTHQFGSVNCDGQKISWSFGEDSRFQMQVNPWTFSLDTLIGYVE